MSLGGHGHGHGGHGGQGQPQFRYIQPPSKVLHLRNLPWECGEEEIVDLCNPFGRVINTKCNVGANRNQAFVEFADLNQAIAMVSYYASSSEPARVRGKTVYLQYSNRQEVVNNKNTGDVPSNVLLVTIEGVEAGDVTIDVLHLVFSAFGFVHKIATFEKTAGFQALVQFNDPETASSARQALDGRSIPRYLLAEHVGTCHLRISFSAHNDLNIKFQSHRSRDYTNPYLPVAPSAMDTPGQDVVGPDGKKEADSNVLLASIENMQYIVTIDALHAVFSAFGTVQKIAMFEKNAGLQALIQYADVGSAVAGKEALEGHCIYEGGHCKLHLSYSRHTDLNVKVNNDRSRDYTLSDPSLSAGPGTSYPDTAIRQLDQDNAVNSRAANNPPYPQGMESNGPLLSSPAYDSSHAMMNETASPRGLLSLPHQGGLPWSNPRMPYSAMPGPYPPSGHHSADGAVPGLSTNPHLGSPYPGSSSTPSYGQYRPTQHPPSLASSSRHADLQ